MTHDLPPASWGMGWLCHPEQHQEEGASNDSNETALRAAPEWTFIGALDQHGDQASLAVRHTKVVVHVGQTSVGLVLDRR